MKSKHQNKKLPSELLVDIFKATDGAIMESLPNKISSMSKQKEFEKLWINQVNKLLTSSSIVYIFVGKIFKKRWLLICENMEKVELFENLMEKNKLIRTELLNILKEINRREERRRLDEEIVEEYAGNKTKILKRRKSEGDIDDEYCPCVKRSTK